MGTHHLDEFNSSAPNILIRLHEVLDALERGGDVVLSEDASEAVQVNKGKTKVIALMNPPGKGYFGREPLDPAQLRRWVYKKMPGELPAGTFSHATDALFGMASESQHASPDMFLQAREQALTSEQLQEIPGIQEALEKYKEFHKAAKELLKGRKIAEDQPQAFTFDDRMEPRRVRDFVLKFYNGDISETFQQALRYYYANKLESDSDRRKLGELIRLVEYKPKVAESKRKGLEREEKAKPATPKAKPELMPETKLEGTLAEQMKAAVEILGKENVFGPKEVEKTFGVRTLEAPGIPFSVEELDRGRELGQMLVLRVDKTEDGKPMSIGAISDIVSKKWKNEAVLRTHEGWKSFIGEDAFTKNAARAGWALVSREVLADSLSKSYIEQTEVLIKTLKEKAFKDMELPEAYQEAIKEFQSQKDELVRLMIENWQEAARRLSALKITQLTRQSLEEVVYDLAMYYDANKKRLLADKYAWTSSLEPLGDLVGVGGSGSGGVRGNGWGPDVRRGDIGVSLSRRL